MGSNFVGPLKTVSTINITWFIHSLQLIINMLFFKDSIKKMSWQASRSSDCLICSYLFLSPSTALSYLNYSPFLLEAQVLHILCTGYKRGVCDKKELCWGKTSRLPEEYMYGKSECMKIIIGCNHFYGGYCLKRDFKGILRYFKVF